MQENCTCSFTIREIDSVPLLKMVIQIKERLKFKGRIGQQIRYQIYLKYQIFHLNHIMLFSEETNQIFQFVFFKVFFYFYMFIQSSYFPEGWNSLKMALAIETVAVYHIVSISRMLSLVASLCLIFYQCLMCYLEVIS